MTGRISTNDIQIKGEFKYGYTNGDVTTIAVSNNITDISKGKPVENSGDTSLSKNLSEMIKEMNGQDSNVGGNVDTLNNGYHVGGQPANLSGHMKSVFTSS